MKFVAALCLTISVSFLTACNPTITRECSWAEPIRFDPKTKEWLGGLDWPQSAYADFNKIGDHNELYVKYCRN
jgi:hypothetical protein